MRINNTELVMNKGWLSIDGRKVAEIINLDIEAINKVRMDTKIVTQSKEGIQVYTVSLITKKPFWKRIKDKIRKFFKH